MEKKYKIILQQIKTMHEEEANQRLVDVKFSLNFKNLVYLTIFIHNLNLNFYNEFNWYYSR